MTASPIQDRMVVVTGASKGVGRAIVHHLLDRGVRVAAIGRDRDRLESLMVEAEGAEGRLITYLCDVTDELQVTRTFETIRGDFGGIDGLILSAGIETRGAIESYSIKDWQETLDTNLTGPFLCCRASIPALRKSQQGAIIGISSGAARKGYAGLAAYSASKFGLMGFMESLADELGESGIRVSSILPGSIMTTFGGKSLDEKRALRDVGRRYLQPEDVARAVIFLLESPEGSWTQEMNLWPF